MSMKTVDEVFPNPRKGKLGLPDIERHSLVAKHVQIHPLQGCGAFIDKDESFNWNRDFRIAHETIFAKQA